MRLPSINYVVTEARRSFARFPLVMTSALAAAALGVFAVDGDSSTLARATFTAQMGIPLFFAVAAAAERLRWSAGIRAGVSIVGAVLLATYGATLPSGFERIPVIRHVQFVIAVHLLVAFLPYVLARELAGFWQYNKTLFLRFLTSAIFSVVLYAGLVIALLALDQLLGLPIPEMTYLRLLIVIGLVFNTWMFVGGVPDDLRTLDHAHDYPRALKVFAQYILVPLVSVYLVILTAYLVKVVVTTEWPSGWIGYLVSTVAAAGILALLLVHPIAHHEENRWVATFSRVFYVLMLPSIAMLLMAIYKRIDQYGVTENRYFLAVLAVWLAGVALYFIFSRRKSIKTIPVSLCLIALATSFGPWGAYAVSRKSQMNRLQGILERHDILVEGRIVKTDDGVPMEDRREISAILRYVLEVHGTEPLDPWFDGRIAEIDTTGTDGRTTRHANQTARLLQNEMGVPYVERWTRVNETYFHYTLDNSERVVALDDADYMIRLNRYSGSGTDAFGGGYRLEWNADSASVDLRRGDLLMVSVYADTLLDRVGPAVEARIDANAVPANLMTVRAEHAGARLVVRFTDINGPRDETGERTVNGFNADCFVTLPR